MSAGGFWAACIRSLPRSRVPQSRRVSDSNAPVSGTCGQSRVGRARRPAHGAGRKGGTRRRSIASTPRAMRALVAGFLLSTAGCGPSAHESVHPGAALGEGVLELSGESASPRLASLRARLRQASLDWEVGALGDSPDAVFGNIVAATVAHDSVIFVLDALFHEVRAFDDAGAMLFSFGMRGEGPLEFRDPVALLNTYDGDLAVATTYGIKFFRRSAVGVDYHDSWAVGPALLSPVSMCRLGQQMVVRGPSESGGGLLGLVDANGEELVRFGSGYHQGSWLTQSQLSDGFVTCVESPPTVVNVFRFLPWVVAYGIDGAVRWRRGLEPFSPQRFLERTLPDGRPALRLDRQRAGDQVLGVTTMPEGMVLVQVARIDAAEKGVRWRRIRRRDTYVVSVSDGQGLYVGDRLPLVLHADAGRLYVAAGDQAGALRFQVYQY